MNMNVPAKSLRTCSLEMISDRSNGTFRMLREGIVLWGYMLDLNYRYVLIYGYDTTSVSRVNFYNWAPLESINGGNHQCNKVFCTNFTLN